MTETDTDTPRAWIGCLSCYNGGRLRGEWITAETAAEELAAGTITYGGQGEPATYPGGGGAYTACRHCGGDEWDVFDTDGVPGVRGVRAFYEQADTLAGMDSETVDRLVALARIMPGDDFDTLVAYDDDHYVGCWSSFRDYAESLADDIGLLGDMPEALACYFDWDAWARDLAYDYCYDDESGHCWHN